MIAEDRQAGAGGVAEAFERRLDIGQAFLSREVDEVAGEYDQVWLLSDRECDRLLSHSELAGIVYVYVADLHEPETIRIPTLKPKLAPVDS